MHRYIVIFQFLVLLSISDHFIPKLSAQTSQVVNDVEIRGNRAIPSETIKLYIQTKRGDTYNNTQVERDFQAVMAQGFFDEFESRVFKEEDARGNIVVVFYIKERPVIRDIIYQGLSSVQESDVIQRLRERRVPVSKESRYDPVSVEQAKRVLAELLSEKGRPNAQIDAQVEEISANTIAINFVITEGARVRIVAIDFQGNTIFSDRRLRKAMKLVKAPGLFSIFSTKDIYDKSKLDDDLQRVRLLLGENGYLRTQIGDPTVTPVGKVGLPIPLFGRSGEGIKLTIPITEGNRYNFGQINVEGNSLFTSEQLIRITGMKTGEVASAKVIREGVYQRLRKLYGSAGYIQATTYLDQEFDEPTATVKYTIRIDEGRAYRIRRIEFQGNTITRDNVLRREILVDEGELFNQELLDLSRLRLGQLGLFEEIKEEDLQFITDDPNGAVDIALKVKEKGRQQISFNGGVAGAGGSFIGISYSTNNLLGYGESLSFDVQAGNRQRNFSVSFTEPYLRGRPISLGLSLFNSRQKFSSSGFSAGALNSLGFSDSQFDGSLFTQTSSGFSVNLSAPLTYLTQKRYLKYARFTRIGLSYGYSSTKVTDPVVNSDSDSTNDVFISYRQPNIRTSTITPSIIYNTLNSPIDATRGLSLSASFGLSGLGGDVKLFSPSVEVKYFKSLTKGEKPHVIGQRFLFQHVNAFGSSPATNSLAFIGGVPVYNRFFLGGDDSLRGYGVRSISPTALVNSSFTSTNVQAVQFGTDRVLKVLRPGERVRGVDARVLEKFTFNNRSLDIDGSPFFTPIGADTQLLYNFEYRVPIAGPLSVALFADAGTTFNIASLADQSLVTNPRLSALNRDPRDTSSVTPVFILNPLGRLASAKEVNDARTPELPANALPKGFRYVQFQGMANTTTTVRLRQTLGGLLDNFRSSVGAEFRVQVPVVNVPFRLIFAYNPNARVNSIPGNIFQEKKTTIRFSIGRTF